MNRRELLQAVLCFARIGSDFVEICHLAVIDVIYTDFNTSEKRGWDYIGNQLESHITGKHDRYNNLRGKERTCGSAGDLGASFV